MQVFNLATSTDQGRGHRNPASRMLFRSHEPQGRQWFWVNRTCPRLYRPRKPVTIRSPGFWCSNTVLADQPSYQEEPVGTSLLPPGVNFGLFPEMLPPGPRILEKPSSSPLTPRILSPITNHRELDAASRQGLVRFRRLDRHPAPLQTRPPRPGGAARCAPVRRRRAGYRRKKRTPTACPSPDATRSCSG